MLDLIIPAFVTLFIIIDPIGLVPVFMALTTDGDARYRRTMAAKGVIIAFFILLFFALLGEPLLAALGISMPAFRMAGGILLFLIGLEMVFEKRGKKRNDRAEAHHQHEMEKAQDSQQELEDISAFPLAIPFLSGPGAIATIMLLMSEQQGDWLLQLGLISALAAVLLISFVLFLLSGELSRYLPDTVTTVISRLLGMLLAAMAIQFFVDGIKAFFNI